MFKALIVVFQKVPFKNQEVVALIAAVAAADAGDTVL